MTSPGLAQGMPVDDSWAARKFEDLQRQIIELRAAKNLNAASVGDSGLTIIGGAFEFPLITAGSVPGSIYWDDSLGGTHPAIYADTGAGLFIQGADDATIGPGENSYIVITPGVSGNAGHIQRIIGVGGADTVSTNSGESGEIFINALGGGQRGIVVQNTGVGGSEKINLGNGGLGSVQINPQVLMQFAGGLNGMYYYEDFDLAGQSIAATTQATLTGMTAGHQFNDYAAAMNTATGVWTAPVAAIYNFTLCAGFTTWVSGNALTLRILDQTANRVIGVSPTNPAVTVNARDTLSARHWVGAGSTVIFQVTNGTSTARTITTTAPETSFISIQREL